MTRSPRSFARRLSMGAITATLCLAAVLAGTAAYAALVPAVTAAGSVKAGTLSATVTAPPNATMRNSDTSVAMPFTVKNTSTSSSTQRATTSVKFSSDSSAFGIGWVWPVANTAACPLNASIGGGSSVSPWPAGTTLTTSLAPGESQVYCVRSMQTGTVASATGSTSMNITAAATLSIGSFQATHQASAKLTTKAIYPTTVPADNWYRVKPFGQDRCLDVTGGVNAAQGSLVGTYTCHTVDTTTYGNQWFSFKQLEQAKNSVAIRPNGPAGTSLQPKGSTQVEVRTTDSAAIAQQWLVQQVNATTYQLVHTQTGLCVTAPSSAAPLSLAICDDLNSQRFTLSKVNVAIPTKAEVEKPATDNADHSDESAEAPQADEADVTDKANETGSQPEASDPDPENMEQTETTDVPTSTQVPLLAPHGSARDV